MKPRETRNFRNSGPQFMLDGRQRRLPSTSRHATIIIETYVTRFTRQEDCYSTGKNSRMPREMRKEMLNTVHECHLGMEKCKARARNTIYWPGMSSAIKIFISRCKTCNRFKKRQQKEPLIPHDLPDRPWKKLGMDLFEYGAKDYLVVVDYYSKYPEISLHKRKPESEMITHLLSILARHGILETIVSDNQPFSSREFKDFARKWDSELCTSSPTNPQSNGLSERAVQTVKNIIRKSAEEASDPYIALLEYRNAHIAGMNYSPAQLLMSGTLRSRLPAKSTSLMPRIAKDACGQLRMSRHAYITSMQNR
ncbi:PREDICTED: uncharacterized protein K02A2.6-like [Priapulus caudatus]|uniref:RNA-directed DNA polymerase n=1 Tax=Priapulus caudatus TaxID=37621 RepID=A0ABM1EEI9_PRICU|nr:PREDICTED: uncharacterized protein K02A2.6-like [Priapulus caudatus]